MGYVQFDVDISDPRFGRLVPCQCNTYREQIIRARSGLTPLEQARRFSDLARMPHNTAPIEKAMDLAVQPRGFFTLYGPNGTGKSWILTALAAEALRNGYDVLYGPVAEIFDDEREEMRGTKQETHERVANVTVLILDECEKFNPTDWAVNELQRIVGSRYRNIDSRLTCFAMNVDVTAPSFPEYVRSRMDERGNHVFNMTGPNLREIG